MKTPWAPYPSDEDLREQAREREKWAKASDHFRKLATERADEGTSVQLACLVLAQYCLCLSSGEYGGPTSAMVDFAENTVGKSCDEVVTSLTKDLK